jgi:mannosyl-glycoprotein endo-beta-N-acetylglucosaminidase
MSADALFVNYTWTPEKLPATVSAAGGRRTSVYMGVDVFGRGSYGGGGFGSTIALAAAKAAGLSAALFAPGWVRENLDRSHFHRLQDTWWTQVGHSGVVRVEWRVVWAVFGGSDRVASGFYRLLLFKHGG